MIEQVVDRRDDGADGEAELEAEGDVARMPAERQHGRPDALAPQFPADRGADDFRCRRR